MRRRSPHLFTHTLVTYTHHFLLRQHTHHYTYKCEQFQHLSGSAYTSQTPIAMYFIPTNKPLSVLTKQDILQPTDHPSPVLHSNQQAFIRLDLTGPPTHVLQICTPLDFYTPDTIPPYSTHSYIHGLFGLRWWQCTCGTQNTFVFFCTRIRTTQMDLWYNDWQSHKCSGNSTCTKWRWFACNIQCQRHK